jgi:CRP-like cAMP-binding protein
MTIEDDIAFFERVPTLSVLERSALRILAIGAESRYVHGGEVLFHAGEAADAAYLVQEGSFSLRPDDQNDRHGATVGPGTLLGELALIVPSQRPATATALEPSTVIRISRGLFLKMLEGYPDVAQRIRDSMIDRVEQWTHELGNVKTALETAGRERLG